jgi:hypothetical protein
MRAYDQMLGQALDALTTHLGGMPGIDPRTATEARDALSNADFPGLLAVLGTSGKPDGQVLGQELLHGAAAEIAATPELQQAQLSGDQIESALSAIFAHGAAPGDLFKDPAVRDMVVKAAVAALATRGGVGIDPEQAAEAYRLLMTGQFFSDVESSTAAVVYAVRGLPIALVDDVKGLPFRWPSILAALVQDLAGTLFQAPQVLADLIHDGRLDHPPAVLNNTLRVLYGFSTLRSTATMVSTLISKDNKSVRLAIIVYARLHHIPLEEKDLDLLRDNVFNTATPDLRPVLATGADRLIDLYGKDGFLGVLRQLPNGR